MAADDNSPLPTPKIDLVDNSKHTSSVLVKSVDAEALDAAEEAIVSSQEFTDDDFKRLRRKVDLVIMPVLMIMYGIYYAGESVLSQGVPFGLAEDTRLKGNEYGNLQTFYYVALGVAQMPIGYLMQRFPIGRALSVFIMAWGALIMLCAACTSYAGLAVVRSLLGCFIAATIPGFAILTSSWFLRGEQTLRQGLYYQMNTTMAIVFGIGNYALAKRQQERGGLSGWKAINLFIGGVTLFMGLVSLLVLGTPDEVWWLSRREKRIAKARVVSNATGGGEQHPWRWAQVRECFRDPTFYMGLVANILFTVPNGAVVSFITVLLTGFGFDNLQQVLFQFPLYTFSSLDIVASAAVVHYYPRLRFPVCIANQVIGVFVFLFVGLSPTSNTSRYVVFVMVAAFNTPMFIIWPLMSANIAGRTKKTFNAACMIMAYSAGNVIGSQIMLPSDAPRYIKGLTAVSACMAANLLVLLAWWRYYVVVNRRREAAFVASGLGAEQREHESRVAGETDMTDIENRHFRYTC
ncbi:putative transporter [Vanrija pseudolonga]|uniref:Purtative transporter n=1 Tax=Vanrija pseudolonga TaxID=143232 RepID=A0AAF0YFJ5_9TREE|nr:purtative transporter [Vanrija pseudolonga]